MRVVEGREECGGRVAVGKANGRGRSLEDGGREGWIAVDGGVRPCHCDALAFVFHSSVLEPYLITKKRDISIFIFYTKKVSY